MLPGITLTTVLLFLYPGEDEEKAGRLYREEKTLFLPGKRGNKGINCIKTYTVPAASSPWAPEPVVTVWQCTAAGCVVWLIYSCQLHSSLLVPWWGHKSNRGTNPERNKQCVWVERSVLTPSGSMCCDWLGGSVMLADVCAASSHCSAALTVAFTKETTLV